MSGLSAIAVAEAPRIRLCGWLIRSNDSRLTLQAKARNPDLQGKGEEGKIHEGVMQMKKAFLIFSFVAVTIFGLLYGISPRWYAATFLDITDLNPNVAHILRAIAGLYLALAAFWLHAAFNDKYRDAALVTAILFAGGLVAGRCVSLIADGQPAPVLLVYGAMEFAVILIGYWVYRLPDMK